MSNTTDVLIVGGADDGKMVCMPLDETRIELGAARYTPAAHELDGKNYWIAYPFSTNPDDVPDQATIDAAIVAANHQPAWDLNRPPAENLTPDD